MLGKGTREGMCSLSDGRERAREGKKVFANVSAGADTKANAWAAAAHLSDLTAAAEGSNLLSTIAPGTPTPLCSRLSSVMVFSRKETSGIPQKSVIPACSSTTVARFSAASPVMSLTQTLHHQGTQQCYEKLREGLGRRRQGLGCHRVFAFLSAGADTKANTVL